MIPYISGIYFYGGIITNVKLYINDVLRQEYILSNNCDKFIEILKNKLPDTMIDYIGTFVKIKYYIPINIIRYKNIENAHIILDTKYTGNITFCHKTNLMNTEGYVIPEFYNIGKKYIDFDDEIDFDDL
jgi:hypothetical protein